jgi:quinol monooxygenase YgiN
MFALVYRFRIHENTQQAFIASWAELTRMIRKHEGSLGSRLHKEDETTYIAYAQWPSKAHWEASGEGLPPEADAVRQRMRACCISVERLHELECVQDLLETASL